MDPKQQASVKVDIKKFSRFMYSHVLQPTDVICSMSPHSTLLSSSLLFSSLHLSNHAFSVREGSSACSARYIEG